MVVNLNIPQRYKCIDRSLFEKETFENTGISYTLKDVKFIGPNKEEKVRPVFVSRDDISHVSIYNDGLRKAEVFFTRDHSCMINDRQRNPYVIDVKYLPQEDMVVIANKHYDLTSEYSCFKILNIKKNVNINPENDPQRFFELISMLTNSDIKSFNLYEKEPYTLKKKKVYVGESEYSVDESLTIKTSQFEIFINGTNCIVCRLANKNI